MKKQNSWAVAGYGSIGKELIFQLSKPNVAELLELKNTPEFVIRKKGVYLPSKTASDDFELKTGLKFEDLVKDVDVLFVALPSTETGNEAFELINKALKQGKKVVTCEKGALANHYQDLKDSSDNFKNLGINATVGGGTRVMHHAEDYCVDKNNISQIHLVLNGTLTSIFSSIGPYRNGSGMSLGQAVGQAVQLGYAEPGAVSAYEVIRQEAEGDIPKKASIFVNKVLDEKKPIDWHKLVFKLTDKEIAQVVEEARNRRFIFSIYSDKYVKKHMICPENGIIGGFTQQYYGWLLVAGFRVVERNSLFGELANLTGPGNGMIVGLGPDESDGVYELFGPGAGPSPTVNSMIDDYKKLKNGHQ